MKFKRLLAIVLVVIIATAVFAGCNIISKNEERDYNQVLATVSYNGLTATVTKGEFNSSFNSLAYYYVYYYGYTVDQAAQTIMDSLANRKLLILYVRDEIAKNQNKANTVPIADLLTATELNEAIKTANESMQTLYDEAFETLWSEWIAVHPEDDPDYDPDADEEEEEEEQEEETETPRPSRPDKAEAEVDYDSETVPEEDVAVKFFEAENHYEDDYNAAMRNISDKAVAQVQKTLADNYISYEYYLESAQETRLLEKFQRGLGSDYNLDNGDLATMISDKRDEYIRYNQTDFAVESSRQTSYESALATLYSLIYHPTEVEGYGYVYNILLQFSEEQTAALTAFKAEHTDEAVIEAYRNALAAQILVNVTNPYYDAEDTTCEACNDNDDGTVCLDRFCTSKLYQLEDAEANEIIAKLYSIIKGIEGLDGLTLDDANDTFAEFYKDGEYEALADIDGEAGLSTYEKYILKREAITRFLYLVNDDTGMYDTENNNAITGNNLGYLITPDGFTSSYVAEFTGLARELITGSTETSYGIDKMGTGLGSLGYCVTDYGIHIIFVSYVPYEEDRISSVDDKEANTLPLDYIIYFGRYNDDNDKDMTLEEAIFEAMKEAYISKEYTAFAQGTINSNTSAIVKNEKLWEKLMKEYAETYGG